MDIDFSHLSVTLSIGTLLAAGVFAVRLSMRVAVLAFKVETMWLFQMRRGVAEMVTTRIGVRNSPLVIYQAVKEYLGDIKDDLQNLYKSLPQGTNDLELGMAIEAALGDRLLNKVCLPCKISYGACLIIALAIAKGSDDIILETRRPLNPRLAAS